MNSVPFGPDSEDEPESFNFDEFEVEFDYAWFESLSADEVADWLTSLDEGTFTRWTSQFPQELQKAVLDRIDELTSQWTEETRALEVATARWRRGGLMLGGLVQATVGFAANLTYLSVDMIRTTEEVMKCVTKPENMEKLRAAGVEVPLLDPDHVDLIFETLHDELTHVQWLRSIGAILLVHALLDQLLASVYGLLTMSGMMVAWFDENPDRPSKIELDVYRAMVAETSEKVRTFDGPAMTRRQRIAAIGQSHGVAFRLDGDLERAWNEHRVLRNRLAHCRPARIVPGHDRKVFPAGSHLDVYSVMGYGVTNAHATGAISVAAAICLQMVHYFEESLGVGLLWEDIRELLETIIEDGREQWFPLL